MNRFLHNGSLIIAGALAFVVIGTTQLIADGLSVKPVSDPLVKKECSACHMLYPAGLLPARSWQAMMANLDNHFGDNASLDDQSTAAITAYLKQNAADSGWRGTNMVLRGLDAGQTPERIVDLPWWKRKHEKKDRVSPAAMKKAGAKFKGDCKACHEGAEQGLFDED